MYEWTQRGGGGGEVVGIPVVASAPLSLGQLVYLSGNRQVSVSDRTDLASIYVLGVASKAAPAGGVLEIAKDGEAVVLFETGLALNPGDPIYLATNGRASNVAPAAPGEALVEIGELLDASGYNPLDPNPTAEVVIEVDEPVILS